MRTKTAAVAAALAIGVAGVPAGAQIFVSSDQASFDAVRPGITSNSFSFPTQQYYLGSYTQGGVAFRDAAIYGVPANSVSPASDYLEAQAGTFTVSFGGPVLGLTFIGYRYPQAINYVVNGQAGTFNTPADGQTSFLGFDLGREGAISVRFNYVGSFLVTGFQTAVPETSTWAMMMVGLGVVGGSLRRRQKVSTRISLARA